MEKKREEREESEWEISREGCFDSSRGVYAEGWRESDEFNRRLE